MNKFILICLSFVCSAVIAQNTISGVVFNDKDLTPIESASVYINGTTTGTSTDQNGNFTIENISYPCQLIISHISYDVNQIYLVRNNSEKLNIYLTEKSTNLSDVSIIAENKRKEVIKEFKEVFLGNDRWGKNAKITNEDVLFFFRKTDTINRESTPHDFEIQRKYGTLQNNEVWSKDSSNIISNVNILSAKSRSPLIVELPLLGYKVFIDLLNFNLITYSPNLIDCNYQIYYRFAKNTNASKSKQSKFEFVRQGVYYNSAKHFCKSLFDNKLKENGFLISIYNRKLNSNQVISQLNDLEPYIKRIGTKEIKIIGLKNVKINISYFCKFNGNPIDLTKNNCNTTSEKIYWKNWTSENESSLIFKNDTCTIRNNGTIPDTNLLFEKKIATKRVGTLLPDDYFPVVSNKNK